MKSKTASPFRPLLRELRKVLSQTPPSALKAFISEVKKAPRVYLVGAGRSGLVAKYLAMRLVRLQKETFVLGETVTPSLRAGDLLIAISGSGETRMVIEAVKISRVLGGRVVGLTADSQSSLAKLSHTLIVLPAYLPPRLGSHYQLRELIGVPERSPVKSLFELAALVFLETAVIYLNGRSKK